MVDRIKLTKRNYALVRDAFSNSSPIKPVVIDTNTRYGSRLARTLLQRNKLEVHRFDFLFDHTDPNNLNGQLFIKSAFDAHKNPKSIINLSEQQVLALIKKINPANIHGSQVVKQLVKSGLATEKVLDFLAQIIDNDRADNNALIQLTKARIAKNVPENIANGALLFARERRFCLGKVPAPREIAR